MFRLALKNFSAVKAIRPSPIVTKSAWALTQTQTQRLPFQFSARCYSHAPPLTQELVEERILEILEGYDKVNKSVKIGPETDFSRDLGLDSLDIVEVVMAIEEEFSIGIPDEEADKIRTFKDATELIINNPHAV